MLLHFLLCHPVAKRISSAPFSFLSLRFALARKKRGEMSIFSSSSPCVMLYHLPKVTPQSEKFGGTCCTMCYCACSKVFHIFSFLQQSRNLSQNAKWIGRKKMHFLLFRFSVAPNLHHYEKKGGGGGNWRKKKSRSHKKCLIRATTGRKAIQISS